MKKRLVNVLVLLFVICFVTGCGAKNISKLSDKEVYDYYMSLTSDEQTRFLNSLNETDKERVQQIVVNYGFADFLGVEIEDDNRNQTVENTNVNNEQTTETDKTESKVKKYDPKPEILNANFEDFIFQVDDVVFKYRDGEVLSNALSQFPDNYRLLEKGDTWGKTVDVSLNELVEPNGLKWVYITKGNDWGIALCVRNKSENTIDLKDCVITEMGLNQKYPGSVYLAKGLLFSLEEIKNNEDFSYDNIRSTLISLGIEEKEGEGSGWPNFEEVGENGSSRFEQKAGVADGIWYYIKAVSPDFEVEVDEYSGATTKIHPFYKISFEIDTKTRMCKNIEFDFSTNNIEE